MVYIVVLLNRIVFTRILNDYYHDKTLSTKNSTISYGLFHKTQQPSVLVISFSAHLPAPQTTAAQHTKRAPHTILIASDLPCSNSNPSARVVAGTPRIPKIPSRPNPSESEKRKTFLLFRHDAAACSLA